MDVKFGKLWRVRGKEMSGPRRVISSPSDFGSALEESGAAVIAWRNFD
jgi:hypothetical protein